MTTPDDWRNAQNVLAMRLDAMGDVLMTTPALRAIKESGPGRRLTLLTSPGAAELAPLLGEVDETILYDAPWMKATAPRGDSAPEFGMIDRLRKGRFDAAVVFTVYSQNPLPAAFLCLLAGVPRRLAHCRENPYQLLTRWVAEPEPGRFIRHEVRRQLDLVAEVAWRTGDERLSLCVPPEARTRVRGLLARVGIEASPWALIHPGASAPSRRYPPDQFARAADLLARGYGWQVVFSGGPGERDLVESIRAAMRAGSHSLAGELTLAELSALVECAPVLVTNNTGPAHVAAAVGTPVVDLYALTNPQHAPWGTPHRLLFHDVPCKYCYKSVCPEGHHRCLTAVPPEAVARAAAELLGEALARLSPSGRGADALHLENGAARCTRSG
jgi:lipopolysaccharide heptosyltransferase II